MKYTLQLLFDSPEDRFNFVSEVQDLVFIHDDTWEERASFQFPLIAGSPSVDSHTAFLVAGKLAGYFQDKSMDELFRDS